MDIVALLLGFGIINVDDYKIIPKAPDDKIVHFILTEDLAKACAEDPGGSFCTGYILGAADALDMASIYWPSIRCRSIEISAGEFVKIAKQWIEDHANDGLRDGASTPAASQILQVTRVKWPCPKTKDFDPSTFDDEGLRRDRPR